MSRYGGEEFLVLVPAATLDGTVALANTLRQMIEDHRRPSISGTTLPITASFGVVVSHVSGGDDTAEEALHRADAALYTAKALGRNRVVSWEELAPRPEETAATTAS